MGRELGTLLSVEALVPISSTKTIKLTSCQKDRTHWSSLWTRTISYRRWPAWLRAESVVNMSDKGYCQALWLKVQLLLVLGTCATASVPPAQPYKRGRFLSNSASSAAASDACHILASSISKFIFPLLPDWFSGLRKYPSLLLLYLIIKHHEYLLWHFNCIFNSFEVTFVPRAFLRLPAFVSLPERQFSLGGCKALRPGPQLPKLIRLCYSQNKLNTCKLLPSLENLCTQVLGKSSLFLQRTKTASFSAQFQALVA